MLDEFYRFFLSFVHIPVLLPLIIVGYIWLDKKIFFHAISITLLTVIFNGALKWTFRIPLAPSIGQAGFAFPSGHMQVAAAFYGWLFNSTNKYIVKIGTSIIMLGIAAGLMHFNYHNLIDVLGAFICAFTFINLYKHLLTKYGEQKLSLINALLATILIWYLYLLDGIVPKALMAYYSLLAFSASEILLKNHSINLSKPYKVLATVVCGLLLYSAYSLVSIPSSNLLISELNGLLIGSIAPFSTYAISLIQAKMTNEKK